MNRLTIFAILCSAALILNSCDKEDDPAPPTNTDHITKSPWKFVSAKAGGIDITAQVPACFKDNQITFAINGSGTITEGSNVCTPPSPGTFTWTFGSNNTINLSTPLLTGGSGTFTIVTLNDVSLVVSQNMTIPPAPAPVMVEISFSH